jgi:hypothetical protein
VDICGRRDIYSGPKSAWHLWVGLRYVECNPCRAGMVNAAEECPWSSGRVHLFGEADRSGILDLDFWERAGGREGWAELHQR